MILPEVQALFQQNDTKCQCSTTLVEFIDTEFRSSTCQKYETTVDHHKSKFYVNSNGLLLVGKSTIDDAIQTVVSKFFQARLMNMTHYSTLAGYPGQRRMYDSMSPEYFWLYMANDVYTSVDDC